jgi:hypothetical protein
MASSERLLARLAPGAWPSTTMRHFDFLLLDLKLIQARGRVEVATINALQFLESNPRIDILTIREAEFGAATPGRFRF